MKLTNGIDGKPWGMEVDVLTTDKNRVKNLILEAGKPFFKVPPPVPTKLWKDEIVEEIRKIRDAHAKKFNYDLDAIYEDLKKAEQGSGLKFIDPPARNPLKSTAKKQKS